MKTQLTNDADNKKMTIIREFNAPLETVWKAWTDSEILDKWWAPKPWKARTKTMNFTEGGNWLYAMLGPEGEEHWAMLEFKKISPQKSFECFDYFCDENGNKNSELPNMDWNNYFSTSENGTLVKVEVSFDKQADMQKIIEMGFQEGFSSAHDNLDELLAK